MYCSNCGKILSENDKFCCNCGHPVGIQHNKPVIQRIQLRCNKCNGTMTVVPDENILVCQHCGSKELILESTDIVIERIKNDTEKEKNKAAWEIKKLDFEKHESRKAFEREKLYYEEHKNLRELKILLLFLVGTMVLILILVSITNMEKKRDVAAGKITFPVSVEEYIGLNYHAALTEFVDAGFTNIEVKGVGDLDESNKSDNGNVYRIVMGGTDASGYGTDDYFFPDEKMIIYYHCVNVEEG